MEFAFIGKLNQTNSIIAEILQSNFDAIVSYYNIIELFDAFSENISTHPELIILDLNTYTGLGKAPDNILKLSQYFTETPILVFHPYRLQKLIKPLIEAGANGVISVTPAAQTIIEAVRNLLDGNEYLPDFD
jgi:DNA-binding NarL/FixJ family response regulator